MGASSDVAIDEPEYGWRKLCFNQGRKSNDEQAVCEALKADGIKAVPTGDRYHSHDIEVTLGVDHVQPGLYEVKRLHVQDSGYVDRRFKAGQRGEQIYGRRDAQIKAFAISLERFLDDCDWGFDVVTQMHEFIDQALHRRHSKRFNGQLTQLATTFLHIPALFPAAKDVLRGGVTAHDVAAGFASLNGIFIIADHIYTLVKPEEYARFIGFDSASAEGPRLSYQGVVPLRRS